MTGSLFVVATPIGNMEDVSERALRVLREADIVLCEDTRKTMKLLSRYAITSSLLSYHQHSGQEKMERVLSILQEGKTVALVTDSGTPGISDPGNELLAFLLEKDSTLNIVPVPGACALATMISVAGFPMNAFLFLGFPPQKNKRKKFFLEAAISSVPIVLYESPHRIEKTLVDLQEAMGDPQVVVGRELTKVFETIYRGKVSEVLPSLVKKGEFVIVVKPQKA